MTMKAFPCSTRLEHDSAPVRAVSMTCALLATGGMLAIFLGVVPGGVSPKHSSARHHGGSVMVVRLVADAEGRTETLPVPPEPRPPRKAERATAQAHGIEASANLHADTARDAGFGEVRCPLGGAAVARTSSPQTSVSSEGRYLEAVAVNEGNTAAQDAAFDEVRCEFGMRAITKGEKT